MLTESTKRVQLYYYSRLEMLLFTPVS